MKVKDLIDILKKAGPEADVKIRYAIEISYSDYTRATESRIGDLTKEAVVTVVNGNIDWLVFAADLCDCEYNRHL